MKDGGAERVAHTSCIKASLPVERMLRKKGVEPYFIYICASFMLVVQKPFLDVKLAWGQSRSFTCNFMNKETAVTFSLKWATGRESAKKKPGTPQTSVLQVKVQQI